MTQAIASHPRSLSPAVAKLITKLDDNLTHQLDANEKLLEVVRRKRQALRQARAAEVAECCRQENERVQAISELEKARQGLAGELTQALTPQATEPLSMQAIADHLPEPARGRLLVRRQQLRERMSEIRREVTVAQRATEALSQHLAGLVEGIGVVMTGVDAYGRNGARPRSVTAVSTFRATA